MFDNSCDYKRIFNVEIFGGESMAKGYFRDATCSFKVNVYSNRDGNIQQESETIAGQKNFTFGGFSLS